MPPNTRASIVSLVHALPLSIAAVTAIAALAACSGSEGSPPPDRGAGGTAGSGVSASGGSPAASGGAGTGGTGAAGSSGAAAGGTPGAGGTLSSGGTTGGAQANGGRATGGTSQMGGAPNGGAPASGGGGASAGSPARGGAAGTAAGGRFAMGGAGTAGGSAGAGGSSAAGGSTSSAGASAGGMGNATASPGCGKTPTLKNSPSTANQNTIMVSGASRQFLVRWPTTYDNTHPYRLIIDFHGAGGSDTEEAPSYFGLFTLSKDTTIFAAPSANGGTWDATADLTFVDDMLKAIEADLCIDTSRVEIEGFSQGAAMVAVLACQRPGVFRAAVGHSRGGLTAPSTCQPIPYLGSLGLSDVGTNSQATQTDPFAKWNGCTVTTLPTAPKGGHVCTTYTGCPAADPVRWCSYDGGHTASPTDSGQSSSWMPSEVWPFLSQF